MEMFSEREQRIIKIIGRSKLTIEQITKELFKRGEQRPFDDTISVGNSIRRIIKKCQHWNLDWNLSKIRENHQLYIKKERIK